jgi:hypothetical protein
MPMLASACSIRSGSGAFLSEGELVSGEEPGIEVVEAGDPPDRVDARFALLC